MTPQNVKNHTKDLMYSEVDETSISKHNRIMTKAINEMKKDMQ
jgi:hypothetical protein